MDKFEELMNEGKMNSEPTPDFVDRVMNTIENESMTPVSSFRRRTRMYSLLAVAASVLAVVIAFGVLTNSDGSSTLKKSAITNTTTTTTTILPEDVNPEAVAVADDLDAALASFDKELSSDANESSYDTSKLNDTGI